MLLPFTTITITTTIITITIAAIAIIAAVVMRVGLAVAKEEAGLPITDILDGVLVATGHIKHAVAVHGKRGAVYGDLDGAADHPENLHRICYTIIW